MIVGSNPAAPTIFVIAFNEALLSSLCYKFVLNMWRYSWEQSRVEVVNIFLLCYKITSPVNVTNFLKKNAIKAFVRID